VNKQILPNQRIGILGAGQLGKMLGQSAQKMGYQVAMYDSGDKACGFGVSHTTEVGSYDDREKILDFAKSVDVLTYEFENINADILKELNTHTNLPQGHSFLLTTQHRIDEKTWLNNNQIPTVRFQEVNDKKELELVLENFGYPAIIKTTRFGYDGKGQMKIDSSADLNDPDLEKMLEGECVLEAFSPFDYEASIVVARDSYGTIECFPASVNIHRSGILSASISPANISNTVAEKMEEAARKIAEEAELIGVCGIEFFITAEEEVVVNELAPRPHNTGHYTIEGCNVSQFDQHILAITGRKIVPVRQLTPTLMVNILGQHVERVPELVEKFPEAVVHVYDKGEARTQRKMGHFTLMDEAENLVNLLEEDPFINQWLDLIG